MIETAEVVVIGGGVVGSSVAYHLAEAGCADVLIVERGTGQGLGSTGKATGGVRAQFATAVNIRMSLYSIDFFSRFEEATGHACGYQPNGYLFVATSEAHFAQLTRNRERQIAAGLTTVELLTAQDVAALVPQLRVDDVVGGSFCQSDGFIDPLAVMRGFTFRARERGVRLWTGTCVTGIEVARGAVAGVLTTRGAIATRAVVNASGAWAAAVARLAGVEIPVTPLRRHLVATGPLEGFSRDLPMVIDMSNGFHFRPIQHEGAGTGVLLAWPDEEETPGFKEDFDSSFVPKVLQRARERVPRLAAARVEPERSRAGLYEMTPDAHAIIGAAPGVGGLYLANGFSGHGVMHSPATGRVLAELVLEGEARSLDVTTLAPERFEQGRLLSENGVL